MTQKTYKYELHGTARDEQTWVTKGYLVGYDFNDTFNGAMLASFDQLTKGNAVFGKPGVGCQGPYDITSVLIEQVKQ